LNDLRICIASCRYANSVPVTVRLGLPTEGAGEGAYGRDNEHADKPGIAQR
jgi:hypothetical protein